MPVSRLGLEGYGVRRTGSFAGKTSTTVSPESLFCATISIFAAVEGVPSMIVAVEGTPELETCD